MLADMMYAFSHGSRLVGQIKQISYICLLEKNFGKPQLLVSKKRSLYYQSTLARMIARMIKNKINAGSSQETNFEI